MTEHRSREELTEDQARELKIGALEAMPIGAYLLCKRSAELPIGVWGGNYILNLAQCWCPEPHLIDPEGDCPDAKRMRILGDHVWCPVHDNKFNVRQLMDMLAARQAQVDGEPGQAAHQAQPKPKADALLRFSERRSLRGDGARHRS